MRKIQFVLFSLVISMLAFGCSDAVDQLTGLTPENDVEMGKSVVAQIAQDPTNYPVLSEEDYPEAYAYIQKMTDAIVASDDVKYKDIFHYDEVKIIHNDEVLNAFATPGGFIYVYTGLIHYLDNADDLAGVMGHEIAHASERHSSDQMKENLGLQIIVQILLGEGNVAQLASGFFALKFSREDEAESDEHSVIYLNDTEYACNGAATFFEKLSASGQSSGPEFLSTHPSPTNRVQDINAKADELGCDKSGISETGISYDDFKDSLPTPAQ
ncbi:M48 family metalloprotease [Reichenbachiella carrageenanivorans]|uniref:M48 family metalloprotease n=1 Tax=Reichenbachiella carrageenanivorans TaxID=2979869 RepID=A0ABY6CWX7_9BACT|nr:M48 family metalloprotease [Reichenbachiella carrageenanivorans]UXX78432.1 M48 family metalloprotease [Reichenbachiella carrageenanivorans]